MLATIFSPSIARNKGLILNSEKDARTRIRSPIIMIFKYFQRVHLLYLSNTCMSFFFFFLFGATEFEVNYYSWHIKVRTDAFFIKNPSDSYLR